MAYAGVAVSRVGVGEAQGEDRVRRDVEGARYVAGAEGDLAADTK